jgi:ribosomal protein L16 Arg81 hydroxylase
MNVQEMLAPLARAEFLSRHWGTRALYIPGGKDKFSRLFGWADLNELLNSGALVPPRIQMVRNGKPLELGEFTSPSPLGGPEPIVDPAKVLRAAQSGATIVLNGLHREWPRVRALANDVTSQFGEHTHVNAYCSWPDVPGFALHYDTHEVLVLQVEGRKRWRVHAPTVPHPVTYHPSEPRPAAGPYLERVLTRGDVLYIPRGHWHDAVADTEPSVHLTVGILRRTGLTFQKWLADRFAGDAAWREDLPLAFGADGGWQDPLSPVHDHLRSLIGRMQTAVQDPRLIEQFLEDVVRSETPRRPYQFPHQVAPEPIVDGALFTRPPEQQWVLRPAPDGSGVQITLWGRQLRFKGRAARLAGEVFRRQSFTAGDLHRACPDASSQEVRRMLTELVRAGVLFVDTARPAEPESEVESAAVV